MSAPGPAIPLGTHRLRITKAESKKELGVLKRWYMHVTYARLDGEWPAALTSQMRHGEETLMKALLAGFTVRYRLDSRSGALRMRDLARAAALDLRGGELDPATLVDKLIGGELVFQNDAIHLHRVFALGT
jgi:hypothetical protein